MTAPRPDRTRFSSGGALIALLLLFGVLCLGLLLFFQENPAYRGPEFIPVGLQSDLEADYSANPGPTRLPGVDLGIIWDTISDNAPQATDLDKRREAVLANLLTPVPTVTPALQACQGIHFVYASQDTWTDPTDPTAVHGTDTLLQFGHEQGQIKRMLLQFPVAETLTQHSLIHSARLEMDVARSTGLDEPVTLQVVGLQAPFGELNTNFENQPQARRLYPPQMLAGGTIHVWDVTGIVRDWLTGRSRNDGLAIEPEAGPDFIVTYYSREIISDPGSASRDGTDPVGPRLIINCGGTLPQAVAVNPYTPTPTAGAADAFEPNPAQEPPEQVTPAPSATVQPPSPTPPAPSPTLADPPPTLAPSSPTPPVEDPQPTPTQNPPVPVPPPPPGSTPPPPPNPPGG